MRTRTLLLLAVTCGLLILVAGGLQLLRIANQDEGSALEIGDSGRAGDAMVTVGEASQADGRMTVSVTIGGVVEADALRGFTLLGTPAPVAPMAASSTCATIAVEPVTCTLVFNTGQFTTKDRLLKFVRAQQRVLWRLV